MQKAGVDAHAKQVEKDDYIEYIVTSQAVAQANPKAAWPSGA
jgi:hypothetical protein